LRLAVQIFGGIWGDFQIQVRLRLIALAWVRLVRKSNARELSHTVSGSIVFDCRPDQTQSFDYVRLGSVKFDYRAFRIVRRRKSAPTRFASDIHFQSVAVFLSRAVLSSSKFLMLNGKPV